MKLQEYEGLWTWAQTIDQYSFPYDGENGGNFTEVGQRIRSFKYSGRGVDVAKDQIASYFAGRVMELIKNELTTFFKVFPPFDVCVAVPANRDPQISLPVEVCKALSNFYPWLKDGSLGIEKKQSGLVMKHVVEAQRAEKIAGLYSINQKFIPEVNTGFLVIDDIYETGASIKELCRTLKKSYPDKPIYVVAFAHLFTTERYLT